MTRIKSKRIRNGTKELKRINKLFKGDSRVKVGFPRGTDQDELDKAVWNEFGTTRIPERAFMRIGFREGTSELKRVSRVLALRLIKGKVTKVKAIGQLGAFGVGIIKGSITTLKEPPNSPVTIVMKGSSNPLIDEGSMRDAVTYETIK